MWHPGAAPHPKKLPTPDHLTFAPCPLQEEKGQTTQIEGAKELLEDGE